MENIPINVAKNSLIVIEIEEYANWSSDAESFIYWMDGMYPFFLGTEEPVEANIDTDARLVSFSFNGREPYGMFVDAMFNSAFRWFRQHVSDAVISWHTEDSYSVYRLMPSGDIVSYWLPKEDMPADKESRHILRMKFLQSNQVEDYGRIKDPDECDYTAGRFREEDC